MAETLNLLLKPLLSLFRFNFQERSYMILLVLTLLCGSSYGQKLNTITVPHWIQFGLLNLVFLSVQGAARSVLALQQSLALYDLHKNDPNEFHAVRYTDFKLGKRVALVTNWYPWVEVSRSVWGLKKSDWCSLFRFTWTISDCFWFLCVYCYLVVNKTKMPHQVEMLGA